MSLGETMGRHDPISKSDRVLFAVLAIVLATASAALGSRATYRADAGATVPALTVSAAPREQDAILAQLVDEHRCLSEALYYEARGEGSQGQQAIAEVVLRRMDTGNYGHSICAVVYKGSGRRGCQFSFTCNGALHRPREASAWIKSEQLAAQILTGAVRLRNTTGNATYYHAVSVNPYWAPRLQKTAHIGGHIFYRDGIARVHRS